VTLQLRYDELDGAVGREIGPTEWLVVDQATVNAFADTTRDHQWIHVDPERAASGPFGGPIAHGYLTLALMTYFLEAAVEVVDASMLVNYGAEKLRFTGPVRVGSKVRLTGTIGAVEPKAGGRLVQFDAKVEVDGADRPALVAGILFLVLPPA
jgi:acyl dehydratase